MAIDGPEQSAPSTSTELSRALCEELERRIAELATSTDATFGGIGTVDAILVAVLFLALPLFCVWMAA
jgi:hypothetical protein